jgi:hypothetical protein
MWEIERFPMLGVRVYCEGYISEDIARADGKKALAALLEAVRKEELRDP